MFFTFSPLNEITYHLFLSFSVTYYRQYDFPTQRGQGGVEEYVHRIGRTGRAGRKGRAITFFSEKEDAESAKSLLQMLSQCKNKPVIPKELIRIATTNENDVEQLRLREKRLKKKEKRKRMKVGRPGDWKCSCGAMVFASKNTCFKCGGNKRDNERPTINIRFN